jgi:hypothetical protein
MHPLQALVLPTHTGQLLTSSSPVLYTFFMTHLTASSQASELSTLTSIRLGSAIARARSLSCWRYTGGKSTSLLEPSIERERWGPVRNGCPPRKGRGPTWQGTLAGLSTARNAGKACCFLGRGNIRGRMSSTCFAVQGAPCSKGRKGALVAYPALGRPSARRASIRYATRSRNGGLRRPRPMSAHMHDRQVAGSGLADAPYPMSWDLHAAGASSLALRPPRLTEGRVDWMLGAAGLPAPRPGRSWVGGGDSQRLAYKVSGQDCSAPILTLDLLRWLPFTSGGAQFLLALPLGASTALATPGSHTHPAPGCSYNTQDQRPQVCSSPGGGQCPEARHPCGGCASQGGLQQGPHPQCRQCAVLPAHLRCGYGNLRRSGLAALLELSPAQTKRFQA